MIAKNLRKINIFKIFLGLNILVSLPFLYLLWMYLYQSVFMDLVNPPLNQPPLRDWLSFFGWLFTALVGTFLPLFSAFKLYKSRSKKILYLGIATFHLEFWVISYFLISFGAATVYFLIGWMLGIFLISLVLWRINKKLALLLTIISVWLSIAGALAGFEESYCWNVGSKVEVKEGTTCLPPTDQEKKDDPGISCIAPGWRAHLQCYHNFNLKNAVLDQLRLK